MNDFILAVEKLEAVLLKQATPVGAEPDRIVRQGREVREAAHAYFTGLAANDPIVASASHLGVTSLVLDRLLAAYKTGSRQFNRSALAKLGAETGAGFASFYASGLRVITEAWDAARVPDKLTWLEAVLAARGSRSEDLVQQALPGVADRLVADAVQMGEMATLERILRLADRYDGFARAMQAEHGARIVAFAAERAERAAASDMESFDSIVALAHRARQLFRQRAPQSDASGIEHDMARIDEAGQRRHLAPREAALQRLLARVARAGGQPIPGGSE